MCSRLCLFICIYTTRTAAQTRDLRISLEISTSSRRACFQSTACGDVRVISAASTRICLVYETFGHVIIIILSLHFGTIFWYSLSRYMCVNFDPGAHVIYASGFAFETRCDKL